MSLIFLCYNKNKKEQVMNTIVNFRIEMLNAIKQLNVTTLQKKELKRYITNCEITKQVLEQYTPTEYLNKIINCYGKNFYRSKIIVNAIFNFFFIILLGGLLNFVVISTTIVEIPTKFLLVNFVFVGIFMPYAKIFVRNALIENKSGIKIMSRLLVIATFFIISGIVIFKQNFIFDDSIVFHKGVYFLIGSGLLLVIAKLFSLKYFKYDYIQNTDEE